MFRMSMKEFERREEEAKAELEELKKFRMSRKSLNDTRRKQHDENLKQMNQHDEKMHQPWKNLKTREELEAQRKLDYARLMAIRAESVAQRKTRRTK